jgi:hypothetical protein
MMTMWQNAQAKWTENKPRIIALVAGLVLGPLISNMAGWQVTASAAQAQARAGVVERLASICDVGARGAVADPAKLDWSARGELAKKWAVIAGAAAAEFDVTNACERKLQS